MTTKTETRGAVTIGCDGRQYWFVNGGAKHSYRCVGTWASQMHKFRYALSQLMASQQEAQSMINAVGGPLEVAE